MPEPSPRPRPHLLPRAAEGAGRRDSRQLSGSALADALRDSRARTWALVADLSPEQWRPACAPGVNPIAWELAHLAWFAEYWVLRGPHGRDAQGFATARHPPHLAGPDALFDSARLAHADRWCRPMPSREQLQATLDSQLAACLEGLPPADSGDAAHYFHRLALFHEDMHGEALCWLRAATLCPVPFGMVPPRVRAAVPVAVPGGRVELGHRPGAAGFAFDNELPSPQVSLASFEIDSAPVSALAFARFVDAGGYNDARHWPGEAGAWRAQSSFDHPRAWRRDPHQGWQARWFDQWLPLTASMPAMHLNAFEAEAWCHWAGRRLPSAAEWEHAASCAGAAFEWGASVWEWTADAFAPYPGFVAGPYAEYSAPWFGDHRELRGGAFATHARMHDARFRNFFQPHRTDIFTGFRSVAL